jgi:hypothetical protein
MKKYKREELKEIDDNIIQTTRNFKVEDLRHLGYGIRITNTTHQHGSAISSEIYQDRNRIDLMSSLKKDKNLVKEFYDLLIKYISYK